MKMRALLNSVGQQRQKVWVEGQFIDQVSERRRHPGTVIVDDCLAVPVSRQSVAETDRGALDVADSRWLYRGESQHVQCVSGTFIVQA